MSTLQAVPQPSASPYQLSPAAIFETLNRYQHTMALKGAIDLDLFTQIGAGASTSAEIARRCHVSERGVRILCDFLTILGLLRKTDGEYGLTPDSAVFLDKASPAYFGSVTQFMVSAPMLGKFGDVAGLVRQGGALQESTAFEKENGQWVEFAQSMTPMVRLAAKATAAIVAEPSRRQKILDVAAGSGVFGISIAELNPAAEVTALDWPDVLGVAQQNAINSGVQDRFHEIAGSAFDADLGSGYDLVLIPNFLHHFDAPTNVQFLTKVRKAVNAGGRIATVEFVPNEDRVTPAIAAAFSLIMLANTPSGDAYTFRELNEMFTEAGFGESKSRDLAPTPLTLIITAV